MKEINAAIDELELDSTQQDKFYEALEKMGIEIAVEDEDLLDELPVIESDEFLTEEVEEIPEAELADTNAMV